MVQPTVSGEVQPPVVPTTEKSSIAGIIWQNRADACLKSDKNSIVTNVTKLLSDIDDTKISLELKNMLLRTAADAFYATRSSGEKENAALLGIALIRHYNLAVPVKIGVQEKDPDDCVRDFRAHLTEVNTDALTKVYAAAASGPGAYQAKARENLVQGICNRVRQGWESVKAKIPKKVTVEHPSEGTTETKESGFKKKLANIAQAAKKWVSLPFTKAQVRQRFNFLMVKRNIGIPQSVNLEEGIAELQKDLLSGALREQIKSDPKLLDAALGSLIQAEDKVAAFLFAKKQDDPHGLKVRNFGCEMLKELQGMYKDNPDLNGKLGNADRADQIIHDYETMKNMGWKLKT